MCANFGAFIFKKMHNRFGFVNYAAVLLTMLLH